MAREKETEVEEVLNDLRSLATKYNLVVTVKACDKVKIHPLDPDDVVRFSYFAKEWEPDFPICFSDDPPNWREEKAQKTLQAFGKGQADLHARPA